MNEWERLAPVLQAALDRGAGYSLEDVKRAVLDGRMQFWPGDESAIVTEILDHPQDRVCHYFLAGGTLVELERMVPVVESFARHMGCARMTLTGRRGWERSFIRAMGYKPAFVVMAKELSE